MSGPTAVLVWSIAAVETGIWQRHRLDHGRESQLDEFEQVFLQQSYSVCSILRSTASTDPWACNGKTSRMNPPLE